MFQRFTFIAIAFTIFISCTDTNTKNNMKQKVLDDNAMYMLIGTYTSGDSKGIYVYKLDTVSGIAEYVSEAAVANPSFLTLDRSENYVYAVTEDDGAETSAANAFSFDKKNGTLKYINKQLTKGAAPCYINIDKEGKHVVTANYGGGSVSVFAVSSDGGLMPASQVVQFAGTGYDENRQTQPHVHCVKYSPDGKFLFATDLGLDKIHKFEVMSDSNDSVHLKQSTPDSFDVNKGSGPRHLVFHPNEKYAYLITEMSGEVVGYKYNDGNLEKILTVKADTLNAQGSADIHISPDGKFLYASNRLEGDGIVIFSIDENDGTLTKVGFTETGDHPRNFVLTPDGKLLLVANRDSNNIQVFRRDYKTGLLEDTGNDIELSMPVCIQLASIK